MATKTRKQQLQEMLAEEPSDAFLRYGLAMEYVSEGDDGEAVRQFEELFTITSDYVPSYHQAGQALLRLGRATEAGDVLRRGIASARQQGDLHAAEEMQGLLGSILDS
jgi:thioredoxin-like negative regulator of GroEL